MQAKHCSQGFIPSSDVHAKAGTSADGTSIQKGLDQVSPARGGNGEAKGGRDERSETQGGHPSNPSIPIIPGSDNTLKSQYQNHTAQRKSLK